MKHNTRMAIVTIEAFLLALLFGCTATKLTPQTKATIDQAAQQTAVEEAQVEDQSTIDIAKEKAAATLNTLKGQDSPIKHPVQATNNLVKELHPILLKIFVISALLWAIIYGLSFTRFNLLDPILPALRWVCILSGAALIALPFLPAGACIVIGVFVGLIVYELVRDHGNVKQAISDTESTLGFGTPASSPAPGMVAQLDKVLSPKPADPTSPNPASAPASTSSPQAGPKPSAPGVIAA